MINENHYLMQNFRERMPSKQWRQMLLNREDRIIYRGRIVPLKAKKFGYGVVEIFKDFDGE